VLVLSRAASAPQGHVLFKALATVCASLYLVHHKDSQLARSFIEAGGLRALVPLMVHPVLQLRGQAVETFYDLTNQSLFTWLPTEAEDGSSFGEAPGEILMRRMHELSYASPFIKNLLANKDDSYPGGSFLCLQLLAFYLSWIRVHYAQFEEAFGVRVLRLSQEVLSILARWAQERDDANPDEADLARRLREDFARFGPAEENVAEPSSSAGPSSRVTADRVLVGGYGKEGVEAATMAKEKGNKAYAKGEYTRAIELYSEAIDVPVPYDALVTEGPRRAVYHSNRAAAYLARAQSNRAGATDTCDVAGPLVGASLSEPAKAREANFEAAHMDCVEALELDPGMLKALYRHAAALAGLGREREALAAAEKARAADAQGSLKRDLDLLEAGIRGAYISRAGKKGGDEARAEREGTAAVDRTAEEDEEELNGLD